MSNQSYPRFTYLGPDPTRRDVDPTRPAIADNKSDPTRGLTLPPCVHSLIEYLFINYLITIY